MRSNDGQTLLELVVAVGVSVLVIGALVFAIISSLRNASFSKNQAQATKLAQEGLERVRMGRDRNQCVKNLSTNVNSWNGDSNNTECPGAGVFWNYEISNGCGSEVSGIACYFNISKNGILSYIISSPEFPTTGAEVINQFKRAIVINDIRDGSRNIDKRQKTVTSIVTWTDFSGPHESRLTTLLRKL